MNKLAAGDEEWSFGIKKSVRRMKRGHGLSINDSKFSN